MKNFLINKECGPKIVDSYFDSTIKGILNNIICMGYGEVNRAVNNSDPFIAKLLTLDNYRNKNVTTELKNLSIDYLLMEACKEGMLPFEACYKSNSKGTGKNLRLISVDGKVSLTVNQVATKNRSSRDAVYRKNMQHKFFSQLNLGEENSVYSDSSMLEYYFELTHGHQSLKPKFVVLGIPNDKGGWIVKESLSSPFIHYTDIEQDKINTETNKLSSFRRNDFEEFLWNMGNTD